MVSVFLHSPLPHRGLVRLDSFFSLIADVGTSGISRAKITAGETVFDIEELRAMIFTVIFETRISTRRELDTYHLINKSFRSHMAPFMYKHINSKLAVWINK